MKHLVVSHCGGHTVHGSTSNDVSKKEFAAMTGSTGPTEEDEMDEEEGDVTTNAEQRATSAMLWIVNNQHNKKK